MTSHKDSGIQYCMKIFPLLDDAQVLNGVVDDFPRIIREFSSLGSIETDYSWDPFTDDTITPTIIAEWNVLNQKLGKMFVSRSRRLLSIGGGGNTPTINFLSDSLEYFCVVNPSIRDIEMYKQGSQGDSRILLIRGIGEMVPFKDGSFDTVEIPATLDHCINHEKVLAECFRVLEPGGKLVITGGNNASWYRQLFSIFKIPFSDPNEHHHTFDLSPRILRNLLQSHGFKDVSTETNYFLKLPKFVERRIDSPVLLLVHQFLSNRVLPRVFGRNRGGMLLTSAVKT